MCSPGDAFGWEEDPWLKKALGWSFISLNLLKFCRGVSILVRKSLPFRLLGLVLDPDGRYIIIHAMVECLELLLVAVYIPPPASTKLLHKLSPLIANYGTDNLLLMEDFNMTPNPGLDRFNALG